MQNSSTRFSRPPRGMKPALGVLVLLLMFVTACAKAGSTAGGSASSSNSPDWAFYKGQTIHLTVANPPGQQLSDYMATIVPYMAKYLHATIDVTDDAAATEAAEDLEGSQPSTGLYLGALDLPTVQAEALFNTPVTFDVRKVSWIGGSENEVSGAYACGPSPSFKSMLQVIRSKGQVSVLGVYGGSGYLFDIALVKAYGLSYKTLTGYTGTTIDLGCTRGDGQFHVGSVVGFINSAGTGDVPGAVPLMITEKLPQGSAGVFLNSKVPTFAEFAAKYPPSTTAGKSLMAFAVKEFFGATVPAESLFAPAGTDPAKVAALRIAFQKASAVAAVQRAVIRDNLPPTALSYQAIDTWIQSGFGSTIATTQRLLGLPRS
jgi:hypothetical protein